MAIRDDPAGSPPPAPAGGDGADAEIAVLRLELAALRADAAERAGLRELVEQLREANQHLVLAALSAQTLRDEAEATNQRQSEFLSMLAHELRNPLAPISMAAVLLGKIPDATPQIVQLQATISRQVTHLSSLLDDLLDAARISSGKITLMLQPVLLGDVMERTIEAVRPQLDARRQQLSVHLPAEPVLIEGDMVRLAQVFSNLLVNASKYSQDEGRITLAAVVRGEQVDITFEDNGAGIGADVLPSIFALFTQGPRSLARSEGGLGVGLNVVHNMVHLHGGSVHAASPGLGEGSIFTVTLPISKNLHATLPPRSRLRAPATGYRILLVEDNVDASDTLKDFLELEGHTVSTAYDGTNGLAMACDRIYDVLICDIGLPGMNGFEMIRQLRGSTGTHIPFAIALSGYGQPQDRARAITAGFGHYFVKPVDIDALLALISSSAVSKLIAPSN
ncbi:ATP-binding protein [Janthinobacterium sp.]|uniref:hybrid sensor histidine kinase/response regulator n=1 Tax=Janthinobacterium sp. TaxID=1871054 RepID=UPI00293D3921|nr:ATP-binding protein [Janthinobacterium sp.]